MERGTICGQGGSLWCVTPGRPDETLTTPDLEMTLSSEFMFLCWNLTLLPLS